MGAPPSSTSHPPQFLGPPPQFSSRSGPPPFASPIRPIPSFPPAAASPVTFSEIPSAAVTPTPLPGNANGHPTKANQPLCYTLVEDDFDASGHSASSAFVLFASLRITGESHCSILSVRVAEASQRSRCKTTW